MSDTYRKDFSTKAKEEITPDSSKSTLDRAKEGITDLADKVVGGTQSDHHKGGAQEVFDKTRREKDHQESNTGSLADKTKDTFGADRH